jgi:hypothetical protein
LSVSKGGDVQDERASRLDLWRDCGKVSKKAISFAKTLLGFALKAPRRAQKLCTIEVTGLDPLLLRQEMLI